MSKLSALGKVGLKANSNVINAQVLFNRVRMWLAGVSFHGQRDLYELFGYQRIIDYRNFLALYYRYGLAKRIVDLPALATWADPPQLTADNPEFEAAWKEVVEDAKIWHNVIRLDKMAGLGRFAIMVLGFDDGGKLNEPLKPRQGMKLLYMQPFHEGALSILKWEEDMSNPRFGRPVYYNVNPGRFIIEGLQSPIMTGMNAAQLRQPFVVHHSRVIHVAENCLEDGVFGSSRLEAVYNDVNDMMKVTGGSAEFFWIMANRGMQVDVDKEIELSPEEADELKQEVEEYHQGMTRFIRTRGVTINDLGSQQPNPEHVTKAIWQVISAGTGYPISILTGTATGQIASQQDRANFSDRIAERITEFAHPIVLQNLLRCLVNAGALPFPENLEVSWPEAFKLSPLERAQTSAQMARSAANLTKTFVTAQSATDGEGNLLNLKPLFKAGEMRRIVGFGKHPPVFGDTDPEGDTPAPADDSANQAPTGPVGAKGRGN